MLNLSSIIIFSENPKTLSDFYKKVLQKEPEMVEGEYYGFIAGKTFLSVGPHDKVKGKNTNPERSMINFETTDVKGEFDRIKGLGAHVIAKPYQMGEGENAPWIATLADPDNNFFQLMTPWKGEK